MGMNSLKSPQNTGPLSMTATSGNIPKDILEKCVKAFNDNRGKIEWEEEAILKVLEEYHYGNC